MGVAVAEQVKIEVPFVAIFDVVEKSIEPKSGDWIIEGYVATPDLDLQNDRIEQSALQDCASDLESNSTVLLNHDTTKAIGRVLKAWYDGIGLRIKVLISKTAPDIWQQIKEGVLNKFSIRGRVLDYAREYSKKAGRLIRVIRKLYLNEASLVSVPGNPKAESLGWYVAKALQEVKQETMPDNPEASGKPELSAGEKPDNPQPDNSEIAKSVLKLAETVSEIQKAVNELAQKGPLADLMKVLDQIGAMVTGDAAKLITQAKALASRLSQPGTYPSPTPEPKRTANEPERPAQAPAAKPEAVPEPVAKMLGGIAEAVTKIGREVRVMKEINGMSFGFSKRAVGLRSAEVEKGKEPSTLRGRLEQSVDELLEAGGRV